MPAPRPPSSAESGPAGFLRARSSVGVPHSDTATAALRGDRALPSVSTLWRFLAGADLGRVGKAAATNRAMLRRAWAAVAAPAGGRLTIDQDATRVAVYGPGKEGSGRRVVAPRLRC
jgi:hypothetical protein